MSSSSGTVLQIRIPTDANYKSFVNIRANVLQALDQNGISSPRKVEAELYRENHSCIDTYQDASILRLSQLKKEQSELEEHAVNPSSAPQEQQRTKVTDEELKQMFHVDLTGVVSTEDRHALARCSECKSTDIEIQSKQIRGGDEAQSLFYTCRRCGFKWKQR